MMVRPLPKPYHVHPPFSHAEATELLWIVRGVVRDMVRAYDADHPERSDAFEDELLKYAVTVSDRREGRVHFPMTSQGEPASYCWSPTDPGIVFWHPLERCASERWPVGTE